MYILIIQHYIGSKWYRISTWSYAVGVVWGLQKWKTIEASFKQIGRRMST